MLTILNFPSPLTAGGALRGSMASDGTYGYFHCGGGAGRIQRLALPTGPFTTPDTTTAARSNGVCIHKGDLYSIGISSGEMRKSTDQGVSYSLIGSLALGLSNPTIASNGINLVLVGNSAGVIIFYCSTDDGSTWSSAFDPFGGAGGTDFPVSKGVIWDGTYFVAITTSGATAYSTTGTSGSWTVGATVPKDVRSVAVGVGKIAVGTAEVNVYQTTDHGATWTEMPSPEVNTSGAQFAYVYWIGDEP